MNDWCNQSGAWFALMIAAAVLMGCTLGAVDHGLPWTTMGKAKRLRRKMMRARMAYHIAQGQSDFDAEAHAKQDLLNARHVE
jgi:hypothetical protein